MYQNYTINQLCLPIDLEIKLEENDFAHAIVQFVDSIPDEVFLPYYQSMGRPQYHPRMLLSIILCAYIQGVYSGRQIQNMLIDSIRMRYLSQEQFPNFRTINRFRVHPIMNDILDHSFVQFRELLVQSGLISGSALYIDGTKIEADANKYSFVWKKSILKYKDSLDQKALENYQQMVETKILPELIDDLKDELSIEEIERIRQSLEEKENQLIEAIDQTETVEERKLLRKEKSEVHKQKKRFDDFAQRKMSYEEQLVIMGVRNSFSKTDHDATFMRMKEDHMLNGQLKPAYNVQVAVENYFIIHTYISNDRTDYNTLIPVLEKHEAAFGSFPEETTADSGYCSEKNLLYLKENGITSYIKLQDHEKRKTRAYAEDIGKYYNMKSVIYEDEHYYVCHDGRELRHIRTETKQQEGYVQTFEVYGCSDCSGCEHKAKCLYKYNAERDQDKNKVMKINERWEELKEETHANIQSEKGILNRQIRSIQTEGHFGDIKENEDFRRFHYRSSEKVYREFLLYAIGRNLNKYHRFSIGELKKYEPKNDENAA